MMRTTTRRSTRLVVMAWLSTAVIAMQASGLQALADETIFVDHC